MNPELKAEIDASVHAFDINDIDANIRDFIVALNSFGGIQTEHSCAGHDEAYWDTGYVTFYADSIDDINRLLRALPSGGYYVGGRAHVAWWWCEADVRNPDDDRLRFTIRSLVAPERIRSKFWMEMAAALRGELAE